MKRLVPLAIATLVLSPFLLSQADAAIDSTSGAIVEIAAPPSLVGETLESSTEIFVVDEGSKSLVVDTFVDAFGPGLQLPAGPVIFLPAGLVVNSYIVHFDPDGGVVGLTGGITFEAGETIVGMALHTPYLDASDGFPIGIPTTTYPTGDADRGFESLPGLDSGFIAADLNSVTFEMYAELGIDQARIFTVLIPEPSSIVLLLVSLTMLSPRRRFA